eukprot:10848640-Heterocapsa_arctica.AAC.1
MQQSVEADLDEVHVHLQQGDRDGDALARNTEASRSNRGGPSRRRWRAEFIAMQRWVERDLEHLRQYQQFNLEWDELVRNMEAMQRRSSRPRWSAFLPDVNEPTAMSTTRGSQLNDLDMQLNDIDSQVDMFSQ